jgi:hypothetical protein
VSNERGRATPVIVEFGASDEDIAHVRAAFARAGLTADVNAGYVRLSAGDLPPVTYLVDAAKAVLAAFAAGVAAGAGKDAYELLKHLVRDAIRRPSREHEGRGGGTFQIQDRDNGFEILFSGDEPDAAFLNLFELDLEAEFAGAGVVAWTEASNKWQRVGASSFRIQPGRRRGRLAPPRDH